MGKGTCDAVCELTSRMRQMGGDKTKYVLDVFCFYVFAEGKKKKPKRLVLSEKFDWFHFSADIKGRKKTL